MNLETKTLNIDGMSCSACVQNIENTIQGKAGVKSASVNFASEKLQVTYNPERVTIEDLIHAVNEKGYGANLPKKELTKTFMVKGMTCASCVKRVEDTIKNIQGVKTATVNLATEKAQRENRKAVANGTESPSSGGKCPRRDFFKYSRWALSASQPENGGYFRIPVT